MQKTCSRCGESKPVETFSRDIRKKDGLGACCKPCASAKTKAWAEANPEKARESQRRWREANRDRLLERHRQYYADNRERKIQAGREWREANPDYHQAYREENRERYRQHARRYYQENPHKAAESVARRRSRKANVEQQPYTRREIYDRDSGRCRLCGTDLPFEPRAFEIDHIVPIVLGGPDIPANVQLACRPCNRMKSATLEGQIHLPIG